MPDRLKWFRGERITRESLKSALKQMLRWKYSDETGWGFLLNETRKEYVVGRFIERVVLKEDITDPFGKELHYERAIFQETEFLLQHEHPHLELRNVPRSTTTFLNQLGRAFDFSIALTPLELDVMRFLSGLEKRAVDITVSRITISDMAVAIGIEAKCVLAGEQDVRRHVRTLTANRKFHVSSIGVRFTIDGIELIGEVSHEGRIVVSTSLSEGLRLHLRELVRDATMSVPKRRGRLT